MKQKTLNKDFNKTQVDCDNFLLYKDIHKGMTIFDNDGYRGVITSCDDAHNIVVEYDNGGSGLHCLIDGCELFGKSRLYLSDPNKMGFMNIQEYKSLENEINKEYELKINQLRNDYVEKNRKYNVGDFVYNVTGIIKIERVGYEVFWNNIEIVYYGYRYKKLKGELLRTKDNKLSCISESNGLKLL